MTVGKLAETGMFRVLNIGKGHSVIKKIFSCDLLSLAMTKDLNNCAWFTVIGNVNIIAVAVHTGASCIVLCEGVQLDDDAMHKAIERNVTVFVSDRSVFDSALELNALTGV